MHQHEYVLRVIVVGYLFYNEGIPVNFTESAIGFK